MRSRLFVFPDPRRQALPAPPGVGYVPVRLDLGLAGNRRWLCHWQRRSLKGLLCCLHHLPCRELLQVVALFGVHGLVALLQHYTPSMQTLLFLQWTEHTIHHPRPAAAAADHGGESHTLQPSSRQHGAPTMCPHRAIISRAGGWAFEHGEPSSHKLHTALRCMLWVCEVFGACTGRAGIPKKKKKRRSAHSRGWRWGQMGSPHRHHRSCSRSESSSRWPSSPGWSRRTTPVLEGVGCVVAFNAVGELVHPSVLTISLRQSGSAITGGAALLRGPVSSKSAAPDCCGEKPPQQKNLDVPHDTVFSRPSNASNQKSNLRWVPLGSPGALLGCL